MEIRGDNFDTVIDEYIPIIENIGELDNILEEIGTYEFRDNEGHPLNNSVLFKTIISNLRDKLILDRMHE